MPHTEAEGPRQHRPARQGNGPVQPRFILKSLSSYQGILISLELLSGSKNIQKEQVIFLRETKENIFIVAYHGAWPLKIEHMGWCEPGPVSSYVQLTVLLRAGLQHHPHSPRHPVVQVALTWSPSSSE